MEIHQEAIWPMQIPAVAIGITIALLSWSRRCPQAIPVLLATCWFFVAWAWFTQRYATINWAAGYGAAAFAVEGLLLLLAGAGRGWRRCARNTGSATARGCPSSCTATAGAREAPSAPSPLLSKAARVERRTRRRLAQVGCVTAPHRSHTRSRNPYG